MRVTLFHHIAFLLLLILQVTPAQGTPGTSLQQASTNSSDYYKVSIVSDHHFRQLVKFKELYIKLLEKLLKLNSADSESRRIKEEAQNLGMMQFLRKFFFDDKEKYESFLRNKVLEERLQDPSFIITSHLRKEHIDNVAQLLSIFNNFRLIKDGYAHYEEISHRANIQDATNQSKKEIKEVTSENSPEQCKNVCSICLKGLNKGELQVTDCKHIFHKVCLSGWFKIGNSCPNCREKKTNNKRAKRYKDKDYISYIKLKDMSEKLEKKATLLDTKKLYTKLLIGAWTVGNRDEAAEVKQAIDKVENELEQVGKEDRSQVIKNAKAWSTAALKYTEYSFDTLSTEELLEKVIEDCVFLIKDYSDSLLAWKKKNLNRMNKEHTFLTSNLYSLFGKSQDQKALEEVNKLLEELNNFKEEVLAAQRALYWLKYRLKNAHFTVEHQQEAQQAALRLMDAKSALCIEKKINDINNKFLSKHAKS